MSLRGLHQEEARLKKEIAAIRAKLMEVDDGIYQGCWIEYTPHQAEEKSYIRLCWFTDVATQQKDCKNLEENEASRATSAIELWAELSRLNVEHARVSEELSRIEATAARLGLQMPGIQYA